MTRCDLTPLDFHTGGKLPSCLTTSMFTDPLLPLPRGPGSHTLFYFLLRVQKRERENGGFPLQVQGKFSQIYSFCFCYTTQILHEGVLYHSITPYAHHDFLFHRRKNYYFRKLPTKAVTKHTLTDAPITMNNSEPPHRKGATERSQRIVDAPLINL